MQETWRGPDGGASRRARLTWALEVISTPALPSSR